MDDTSYVNIKAPISVANKVSAIKAIRWLTGLGLKEAKDAAERVGVHQSFPMLTQLSEDEREEQMRILRSLGFEVGHSVHKILEDLRKLGAQALNQGEDELANEILQLVLAEKLRRKNV